MNKEIDDLFSQRFLKEKIEVHLKGVQKRLKLRYQEFKKLELILDKEGRDIVELEKLSIQGLFSKILGNQKEQLERERQEYLLAFLKFHDCRKRIEAKEYEISVLQEKLASYGDVEGQLKALIQKKKMLIKFKNKSAKRKIIKQEQHIRLVQNMRKEIKEALEKGNAALPKIKHLQEELLKMEPWNIRMTTSRTSSLPMYKQKQFIKHTMLIVSRTNTALGEFVEELNDIGEKYETDYSRFMLRISGFLNDFYDGLVLDWIFHEELKVSINIMIEVTDKVQRIIEMLQIDYNLALKKEQDEQEILQNLVAILNP